MILVRLELELEIYDILAEDFDGLNYSIFKIYPVNKFIETILEKEGYKKIKTE